MATALPWNHWAVETLQKYCYAPDGKAPKDTTLGCDLRWIKYRLTVAGDSRDRVVMALRGAPMVWDELQRTKWSPAKVFNKRGSWSSLYERTITAAGKDRAQHPDTVPSFREIFKALADQL